MVYIETLILCENCDCSSFVYNNDCYNIAEKVYNFIQICCRCKGQYCISCTLRDTENDVYCQDCYFKYVSKGLVQTK